MKRHQRPSSHKPETQPERAKPKPRLSQTQRAILKNASQSIKVRKDGKTTEITMREALIQKHSQVGLAGGQHALNQLIRNTLASEQFEMDIIAGDIETGKQVHAAQMDALEHLIRDARRAGLDDAAIRARANDHMPHPDDIVIDAKGWCIAGPFDAASLKAVHELVRMRDAFLLQHSLDERSLPPKNTQDTHPHRGIDESVELLIEYSSDDVASGRSALLLAMWLNEQVPRRFALSESEMFMTQHRHERLTKRELLKACHQAWKALRIPHQRGWLSPPLRDGIRYITLIAGLCQSAGMLAKQPSNPTFAELYEEVHRRADEVGIRVS